MAVPNTPEWEAENKGPASLGIIISVTILSTLFTAARLYVRGKILGKFHLDDYLIVASVTCSWVNVGTAIVAVSYGNGRHFETLSLEQKQQAIFWTIVGFPAGVMSFGLPKAAVVALLTRILNPCPWHRKFLWCMALFTLLSLTINMVCLFIHCQPTYSQWDFSVKGTCWDKWVLVSIAIYTGSLGAFVDAYLAVYPATVLAKLQMSTQKKVALSVALGIGSISSIVAIYKCTRVPSLASSDFSCGFRRVEGGTMIIAACIPTLQPLGETLFGKRMFISSSHKNYKNYGSAPSGRMRSENINLSNRGPRNHTQRHDNDIISLEETTTTTIAARGSQESILDNRQLSGKIIRTDAFSVSVEHGRK
ncbi:integral membrane protein [Colletotrichum musicola]|uniref:Integral membrane protein n=1 Tax=Colletotrichum musicola TaxID=2175873 RepID=A0A8H6ISY3_9PEZI|nr:integral membrane protein [Colletotrichum musicola]